VPTGAPAPGVDAPAHARGRLTRPLARLFNLTSRVPRLQSAATRFHSRAYARTGGRRGGRWWGVPVLVLETVGRRSGKPRRTPIVYVRDGERLLVTPANAGADRTPGWWLNLAAAGEGVALVEGMRVRVRPRVLEGDEREHGWRALARALPALHDYGTFTERRFPLVSLEPLGGDNA
jgi:deazaflavin-dependent oxidoreductase (nitroreductase family)